MSRPNEATDYSVNVCPLYDDDGEAGALCAYAHSESLRDAMLEAGSRAEEWLRAPLESEDDDDRGEPVGFEVVIAAPGSPDPA